jgi:hypothetical protein
MLKIQQKNASELQPSLTLLTATDRVKQIQPYDSTGKNKKYTLKT